MTLLIIYCLLLSATHSLALSSSSSPPITAIGRRLKSGVGEAAVGPQPVADGAVAAVETDTAVPLFVPQAVAAEPTAEASVVPPAQPAVSEAASDAALADTAVVDAVVVATPAEPAPSLTQAPSPPPPAAAALAPSNAADLLPAADMAAVADSTSALPEPPSVIRAAASK